MQSIADLERHLRSARVERDAAYARAEAAETSSRTRLEATEDSLLSQAARVQELEAEVRGLREERQHLRQQLIGHQERQRVQPTALRSRGESGEALLEEMLLAESQRVEQLEEDTAALRRQHSAETERLRKEVSEIQQACLAAQAEASKLRHLCLESEMPIRGDQDQELTGRLSDRERAAELLAGEHGHVLLEVAKRGQLREMIAAFVAGRHLDTAALPEPLEEPGTAQETIYLSIAKAGGAPVLPSLTRTHTADEAIRVSAWSPLGHAQGAEPKLQNLESCTPLFGGRSASLETASAGETDRGLRWEFCG